MNVGADTWLANVECRISVLTDLEHEECTACSADDSCRCFQHRLSDGNTVGHTGVVYREDGRDLWHVSSGLAVSLLEANRQPTGPVDIRQHGSSSETQARYG